MFYLVFYVFIIRLLLRANVMGVHTHINCFFKAQAKPGTVFIFRFLYYANNIGEHKFFFFVITTQAKTGAGASVIYKQQQCTA